MESYVLSVWYLIWMSNLTSKRTGESDRAYLKQVWQVRMTVCVSKMTIMVSHYNQLSQHTAYSHSSEISIIGNGSSEHNNSGYSIIFCIQNECYRKEVPAEWRCEWLGEWTMTNKKAYTSNWVSEWLTYHCSEGSGQRELPAEWDSGTMCPAKLHGDATEIYNRLSAFKRTSAVDSHHWDVMDNRIWIYPAFIYLLDFFVMPDTEKVPQ